MESMAKTDPNRPSLRERVAARRAGRPLEPGLSREEKKKRSQLRFYGQLMQVIGLIALLGYTWLLWESGFETVNIVIIGFLSGVFIIGRALTLSISFRSKNH